MKPSRKTVLVSGITSWAPSSFNHLVRSDVFLDVSSFSGRDEVTWCQVSAVWCVDQDSETSLMSLPIAVRRLLCHVRLFFFFMNTFLVFLTGCSSRSAAKLACPKFASQTRIVQIWQCLRLHDRSPTAFHWSMNEFLCYFSFFLSFVVRNPARIFISHFVIFTVIIQKPLK